MESRIANGIRYRIQIDSEDSVWNVRLPNSDYEWRIISKANNLDMAFINKYSNLLILESIILNEKSKLKKNVSDDYGAEINWNKIVLSTMYRIKNTPKPKLTKGRKEIFNLIKEHANQINWKEICQKRYISSLNTDFLMEFYPYIDWSLLLSNTYEPIDKDLMDFLIELGIINWNEISALEHFPQNFIKEYADYINWDVFLQTHDLEDIPVECRSREDLLIAIRNNPDLINLRGDKQAISEKNDRLKRFVWIDRVAGVEGHLQDDTGLWVDTIRGAAADDADNLESDLEHSEKDAFGEEDIEEENIGEEGIDEENIDDTEKEYHIIDDDDLSL